MARSNLKATSSMLKYWLIMLGFLLPVIGWGTINTFDLLKANKLNIDNVQVDGNTISTTDTNGNLTLDMNGTGRLLLADLTATTVPYLDASKKFQSSAVTPTELGYVSGVTASLCGISQSCVLTGKSLDADNNTITNIDNNEIRAAAAIAVNKLAALTVSRAVVSDASGFLTPATTTAVEIGYVNGVTSAIQTQMDLKAPKASPTFSGTITTPLTASRALVLGASSELAASTTTAAEILFVNGVTSNLCGINQACTFTSKTLTSPAINGANFNYGTASNTNRLLLPTETTANLASLTQTAGLIAYDTTQSKVVYNNGGSWTAVGAGSGSVNFILNPDAEAGTTGWAAYADAAGVVPVDATGGAPTVTWTQSVSSTLSGSNNFLFTKDAANRQGNGASYAFSIDGAAQAKVLKIDFDYIVASGTFVAGTPTVDSDIEVFVYDVTNSTLIYPSTIKLYSNSSTVATHFSAYFQSASNSTSYRLVFHAATTSASAYTVKFDTVSVAPSTYTYGTPITDWLAFTPTGTFNTNTTYTGFWRRVGDSMEIQYKLAFAGAPNSVTSTLNMPTGYTIDTAKLTSTSVNGMIGLGTIADNATLIYDVMVGYLTSTTLQPYSKTTSASFATAANITQASPFTIGAADEMLVTAKVPIVGWSSNVQMSDSADQRVVAFKAYRSAAYTTLAPNGATEAKVPFETVQSDTHGAFSTANNRYVAPVAGYYQFQTQINILGTNVLANGYFPVLYKNGVAFEYLGQRYVPGAGVAFSQQGSSSAIPLAAGDYIEIYFHGLGNNSVSQLSLVTDAGIDTWFSGSKIQGPSAIGATETIALKYGNTAGTSIGNSGDISVPFATKEYDTHSAFSTPTFTAPVAGKYRISATVHFASSLYAANNQIYLIIYKNSGAHTYGPVQLIGGTPTGIVGASVSSTLDLAAGNTIDIRANNNRTAGATLLSASGGTCHLEIERVGM